MQLKSIKLRRTTAIAEPLDALLERLRSAHRIDCFVVAWDLIPPWDREAAMCRWTETLALYEGLSVSDSLDQRFRDFAANRFAEMSRRSRPSARPSPAELMVGSVVAVCMEPLFESAFMDERAMRKSLGVLGRRMKGWPSSGWERNNARASEIIGAAVDAARGAAPTAPLFRKIRQGYETLKTEWGIHFIESRAFDIKHHPFGKRLAEIRKPRKL